MKICYKIVALLICITQASCGGLKAFHEHAQAGDTVAVPLGMQPDFSKDNVTVTITPSVGADIELTATDPAIRALLNFYPDPVSNMMVSRETGVDMSTFASTYGASVLGSAANMKDFYQTTLFLDLPGSLPVGLTSILVSNGLGTTHAATVNITGPGGTPSTFNSDFSGGLLLTEPMLDSMSRATHTTVSIAPVGPEPVPHAVELDFTYDPDPSFIGNDTEGRPFAGRPLVINPTGYLKNLSWSDDGANLKIIMLESKDGIITNDSSRTELSDIMTDYNFYISGSITNLQLISAQGYDIDGNGVDVAVDLLPGN
jgi:hypothetical protein